MKKSFSCSGNWHFVILTPFIDQLQDSWVARRNLYLTNDVGLINKFVWKGRKKSSRSKYSILSVLVALMSTTDWTVEATHFSSSQFWRLKHSVLGAGRSGVWWEPASWFIDHCLLVASLQERTKKPTVSYLSPYFVFFVLGSHLDVLIGNCSMLRNHSCWGSGIRDWTQIN